MPPPLPPPQVLSTEDPETVPLSTFTAKARPRPQPPQPHHHHHHHQLNQSGPNHQQHPGSNPASPYHQHHQLSPMTKYGSVYSPQLANDPLLSGSTPRGKVGVDRWVLLTQLDFPYVHIYIYKKESTPK